MSCTDRFLLTISLTLIPCPEAVAVKRMFVSSSRRKQGKGAPGYLRDVAYAFIRQLFNGLGVEQTQFLTPTTDKVYNYVTKMKRAAPKTVDLETGAKGHWIGHSQANNVMLYIHGEYLSRAFRNA